MIWSGLPTARLDPRTVYHTAPRHAAWMLVMIGLATAWLTARDYGVAWDDSVQTRYGSLVLEYFLSGGHDRECNALLDLCFYGPPVELLGAALGRFAPVRAIELRHLLTAAIALLSIPALYRFGNLLGDRWIGVMAAVALWMTPRFYGHAFLNTKDLPFAVGMTASIAALAALFAYRQYRWREFVFCGLLLGCTVAVRPGGWLLLGPIYLLGVVFADWQRRRAIRVCSAPCSAIRRRSLVKQAVMFAVAWIVMIACWPWAHESPVGNPLQAIRMSSQFHIVVPVLLDGRMYMSDALPRTYLLTYLLITTPVIVLVTALIGIVLTARRLFRGLDRRRAAVYWMMLVWLGSPLALFFLMRPNAYDGLRHFLFVLPAVALFAAVGTRTLIAFPRTVPLQAAVALFMLVALIAPLKAIVQLHPYQIAYFNSLVGGTARVAGRYDSEYWMTSYREAMEWIRSQGATLQSGDRVRVLVAANENSRWCAEHYADERIEILTTLRGQQPGDLPRGIDYYLGTTRSRMSENFPAAEVVHCVQRAGAVFAVVKRRGNRTPRCSRGAGAVTAERVEADAG